MSKNRAEKRKRAKLRKKQLREQEEKIKAQLKEIAKKESEVEYITQPIPEGEGLESLQKAFKRLTALEPPKPDSKTAQQFPVKTPFDKESDPNLTTALAPAGPPPPPERVEKDEESEDGEEGEKPRLSNKKRKLRDRLTIAQLKQVVARPDLVDYHDPNSADPTLLVHLKATPNTVPVPSHWMDKSRYLQGRRGVEKTSFVLPKAIQNTGISELRNPGKLVSLKQKQRQRMNPKLGRLDVDYQKLHAAFFRHMEKPPMTTHGELYYMGKENEIQYRQYRPGVLSKRLRNALHMMEGYPPPYLINMQRFGPPPSYPELRVPGLNAPIPPGCKYGYAEGNWGKPPVDENGFPLYGDPFGANSVYEEDPLAQPDAEFWGRVEENVAYDDEAEDEEMEDDHERDYQEGGPDDGNESDQKEGGTPGGASGGLETPEIVNLRKAVVPQGEETPVLYEKAKGDEKRLYTVLDQKKTSVGEKGTMGSSHTYDIAAEEKAERAGGLGSEKVSVALNEEELASLDETTIRKKFKAEMDQKKAMGAMGSISGGDSGLAREAAKKKGKKSSRGDMENFKF